MLPHIHPMYPYADLESETGSSMYDLCHGIHWGQLLWRRYNRHFTSSHCQRLYQEICTQERTFLWSILSDLQKIELSPLTIANEPLWVLQCLLLVMANGTKSANFRTFQEAASLASLLLRCVFVSCLRWDLPSLKSWDLGSYSIEATNWWCAW